MCLFQIHSYHVLLWLVTFSKQLLQATSKYDLHQLISGKLIDLYLVIWISFLKLEQA